MRQESLVTNEEAMIKSIWHCSASYEVNLTYIQTGLKGLGSPELGHANLIPCSTDPTNPIFC